MNSRAPVIAHPVAWLLAAMLSIAGSSAYSADGAVLWKKQVKGDYATLLANVKNGLVDAQLQITAEEHLSKGIEANKQLFPAGKWNTIGFDNVTAVHFCSVAFNQEVFNIDLDWSILCPFKLVAYSTKKAPKDVTLVMVRPTYLVKDVKNPKIAEVGKRIEQRIVKAIEDGLARPR